MSTHDSYPGDAPDDDYRVGTAGGGGAILGVLMTLVIGSGLVFAAYKLGQRTSVDDPPLIAAEFGEAKMAPVDEGGTPIVNRDNDAYTMIDEIRRAGGSEAERDGIVIADSLPDRVLDPAGGLAATVAQQDAVRIDELQLAPAVEGQPSLTDNDAPDRSGELELAGGAEVQVADSEAVLRAEQAASQALPGAAATGAEAGAGAQGAASGAGTGASASLRQPDPDAPVYTQEGTTAAERAAAERDVAAIIGLPGTSGSGTQDSPGGGDAQAASSGSGVRPLERAADTVVAAAPATEPSDGLSEEDFGRGLVLYPVPRGKPDLARAPDRTPRVASRPDPAASRTAPARTARPPVPSTVVPVVVPVPVPGQVPAPGVVPRQAVIPSQPVGDAQVQLGAMPTPEIARQRWRQLLAAHPNLLQGLGIQLQPVRTAQGQNLVRLRAGPLRDTQTAARLCGQLRVRGVECFVPAR